MEDLISKLGWKKIAGILMILSLATLAFIVFSFVDPSGPQTSAPLALSPTKEPRPSLPRPTSSQSAWKKQSVGSFEISYPRNYIEDLGARQGSRESLVLQPPGKDATINMQSYSLQSTSVSKISYIFSSLGYKQSSITLGKVNASKFYGSVLINSRRVQEVAVVFEANGVLYKLQLAYTSDNQNPALEATFDNIVSSFRLL